MCQESDHVVAQAWACSYDYCVCVGPGTMWCHRRGLVFMCAAKWESDHVVSQAQACINIFMER